VISARRFYRFLNNYNDFKWSVLKTLYLGLGPEEDRLKDLSIEIEDVI